MCFEWNHLLHLPSRDSITASRDSQQAAVTTAPSFRLRAAVNTLHFSTRKDSTTLSASPFEGFDYSFEGFTPGSCHNCTFLQLRVKQGFLQLRVEQGFDSSCPHCRLEGFDSFGPHYRLEGFDSFCPHSLIDPKASATASKGFHQAAATTASSFSFEYNSCSLSQSTRQVR